MEHAILTQGKHDLKLAPVSFIDLKRQYLQYKSELYTAVDEVLSSGNYILGNTVEAFEADVAKYLECKYVISVANGTDAIILLLKAWGVGPGDEVILPTNSFVATAGAVAAVGAIPVLCDVNSNLNVNVNQIEDKITNKTKVIIPVHLTGRPADMDAVNEIANKYNLYVIEDAAQSIGAKYKGRMSGGLGHAGCFSLHPLKNLHVYGDGGLISTNDEALSHELKLLRNHGLINRDTCLKWGLNSRLDALQAKLAHVGLPYIDLWNEKRRHTASLYKQALSKLVETPIDHDYEYAVYHNFVIFTEKRDELMKYLTGHGIETKIHYPIPIHLQPAASTLGYKRGDFPVAERQMQTMMSLPIYSELSSDEIQFVINGILTFFQDE